MLKLRYVMSEVKGVKIWFFEKYEVDILGEEVFNSALEQENDFKLFEIYKTKKNLLTTLQLKDFMEFYKISPKTVARMVSASERDINKFLKGSIQDEYLDYSLKNFISRITEGDKHTLELLDLYEGLAFLWKE